MDLEGTYPDGAWSEHIDIARVSGSKDKGVVGSANNMDYDTIHPSCEMRS